MTRTCDAARAARTTRSGRPGQPARTVRAARENVGRAGSLSAPEGPRPAGWRRPRPHGAARAGRRPVIPRTAAWVF
ncbi:hypothetical protein E0E62_15730 [Streptomyces sp. 16-176A]